MVNADENLAKMMAKTATDFPDPGKEDEAKLSPEEREFLEWYVKVQRRAGREPTEQQKNFALEQAKMIGDL